MESVVATILLILIVIAGAGVIAGAVLPMLKNIETGGECNLIDLAIDTTTGYSCYNPNTGEISIMVTRGSDQEELKNVQIQISSAGTVKTIRLEGKEIKEEGLLGYWNFDEDSENTIKDLSGNNNDGIITGNKLFSEGKFGSAIELEGNAYVTLANPIGNPDELTIEAWINADSFNPTDENYILTQEDRYQLKLSYGKPAIVVIDKGPPASEDKAQSDEAKTGEWIHVAGTIDHTKGEEVIYVNGEEKDKVTLSGNPREGIGELIVGCHLNKDACFDGKIDNLAIFNRALNDTAIKAHYKGKQIVKPAADIPLPNEGFSYKIALSEYGMESIESVSVAPILIVNQKEKICQAQPTIKIPICD